jgi:hypothetical protein
MRLLAFIVADVFGGVLEKLSADRNHWGSS